MKRACEEHEECTQGIAPFNPDKVYQEQLGYREIILNGDVNDYLIEKAVIPIRNINRYDDEMEAKVNPYAKEPYVREPIQILINTSGGELNACMSLVSAIKSSKTPIHTIALGKAYSAGFLILIAGHERYAQEYSSMMIHPGSGGYVGTFPSILKHADHVHELQEIINNYINDHTFVDMAELQEMCDHEFDWYMYAEEALCRGVIDGIIVGTEIITADAYIALKEAEQKAAEKPAKVKKVAKKPTKTTKETK